MAHRVVVGTGQTMAVTKTSTATSSFIIESQYVRLTAGVPAGAHVSISQTSLSPTATTADTINQLTTPKGGEI